MEARGLFILHNSVIIWLLMDTVLSLHLSIFTWSLKFQVLLAFQSWAVYKNGHDVEQKHLHLSRWPAAISVDRQKKILNFASQGYEPYWHFYSLSTLHVYDPTYKSLCWSPELMFAVMSQSGRRYCSSNRHHYCTDCGCVWASPGQYGSAQSFWDVWVCFPEVGRRRSWDTSSILHQRWTHRDSSSLSFRQTEKPRESNSCFDLCLLECELIQCVCVCVCVCSSLLSFAADKWTNMWHDSH